MRGRRKKEKYEDTILADEKEIKSAQVCGAEKYDMELAGDKQTDRLCDREGENESTQIYHGIM